MVPLSEGLSEFCYSGVDDIHRDAVDGVVGVAAPVPRRFQRLAVAGGVGGAATELLHSGLGIPHVSPPLPLSHHQGRSVDVGRLPGTAPIGAHVDGDDRRGPRPRPADELAVAGADSHAELRAVNRRDCLGWSGHLHVRRTLPSEDVQE